MNEIEEVKRNTQCRLENLRQVFFCFQEQRTKNEHQNKYRVRLIIKSLNKT